MMGACFFTLICFALRCLALPCVALLGMNDDDRHTGREEEREHSVPQFLFEYFTLSSQEGGPLFKIQWQICKKGWLRRKRGGDWRKESSWKWNMKIKSQK